MRLILGIDPGSRITGYGIIMSDGQKHRYLASGSIVVRAKEPPARLLEIYCAVNDIIGQFTPKEAAIEQVFMAKNPNSALKLGQARGAAMVAIAQQNLPIHEYSARAIKQAVVGYGGAAKEQVQHMVKTLLSLNQLPSPDAADALGVAICHAQTQRFKISPFEKGGIRGI